MRIPAQQFGRAPLAPGVAAGFTIVELMVVVAMLGILLAIGAPSFSDLIRNNRFVSATYDLRGGLNTARSEALARRAPVTVCASSNGLTCTGSWNQGYIAFVDFDGDGTIDTGGAGPDDELVFVELRDNDSITIALDRGGSLRFDAQGTSLNSSGTFTFCDDRGASGARAIFLANSGQVRTLEDTDGDDIPNLPQTAGGDNVVCD